MFKKYRARRRLKLFLDNVNQGLQQLELRVSGLHAYPSMMVDGALVSIYYGPPPNGGAACVTVTTSNPQKLEELRKLTIAELQLEGAYEVSTPQERLMGEYYRVWDVIIRRR